MKIYDMHIHSFNRPTSVPELLSSMERAGVYGGCVFSNWPKEANAAVGTSFEERLNEVLEISGASNGRIFPVLWIHPYEENIIQKVRIAKDAGVRAFKIICTDFYVYEPPVLNLLREIAALDLPVIFHSGILWDGAVSSKYNRPLNWEALLPIEGLRFSIGHCSWPWIDECIALYGKFLNAKTVKGGAEMFFDITPGTPDIYREELLTKLYTLGYDVGDNIMFGTDTSADAYSDKWACEWLLRDAQILDKLGVSKKYREKLYGANLFRFLGITSDTHAQASPTTDDARKWSAASPETKGVIEGWYKSLGFTPEYDKQFYAALDSISISDAITVERYPKQNDLGKRNLLSYLYLCENLSQSYRDRAIPEKILMDTLYDIVRWTDIWTDLKGELWLGETGWLSRHLSMRLFHIGRLQFCMALSEFDIPSKDIKKGDPVIEIHIPAAGPLYESECRESIEAAREFFAKYYPDYAYKAFTCHSWLLDSSLKDLLPEDSNILKFAALFDIECEEESFEILRYVFKRTTNSKNVKHAYPTSSFAERVKRATLSGAKFHESLGVIDR